MRRSQTWAPTSLPGRQRRVTAPLLGAVTGFMDTLPLLHPYGRLVNHDLVIIDPHLLPDGLRGPGKYDGLDAMVAGVRQVRRENEGTAGAGDDTGSTTAEEGSN